MRLRQQQGCVATSVQTVVTTPHSLAPVQLQPERRSPVATSRQRESRCRLRWLLLLLVLCRARPTATGGGGEGGGGGGRGALAESSRESCL